ncbi:hypothetical protein As57867_004725, partial [Aphanomyces stellatus]
MATRRGCYLHTLWPTWVRAPSEQGEDGRVAGRMEGLYELVFDSVSHEERDEQITDRSRRCRRPAAVEHWAKSILLTN